MNHHTPLDTRAILQSGVLITLLALLCGAIGIYVITDPAIIESQTLYIAAMVIDQEYQNDVNWNRLTNSARDAMIDRLDRYSGIVTDEDFSEMDEQMTGSYGGIGTSIVGRDRGLLIVSVVDGGPADQAGLMDGDLIIRADSVDLGTLTMHNAARRLRGEKGSRIELAVLRPGSADTLTIEVTRGRIPYTHIPYAGIRPDSVAYIRLTDFDAGAAEAVEQSLDSLNVSSNNSALKGFILDLRGNPGGLYREAVATASLFLPAGTFIVGTEGRSRWTQATDRAAGGDRTEGIPMVVMVDRNSASASEITAGALRQAERAVLVGDTTFGKGLVQGFVRIPGQYGLRLTISRYYLDGRLFLNQFDSTLQEIGKGLTPDVEYKADYDQLFVSRLESSLLLQQFAHSHQDELIYDGQDLILHDSWIDDFMELARKEGFEFVSDLSGDIEMLAEMAQDEDSPKIVRMIEKLRRIAHKDDMNQFRRHAEYIKMRLLQLALQRKYSVYAAYKQAVSLLSPEIVFAAGQFDHNHAD
ncbi:MAG TPA: S41 family peptidase [candidate division Zixibacteria bacterium]|nr:S41 family peptidase [candidate division Zixibacteria bacterium]